MGKGDIATLNQLIFLGSILSGFAITIVVQLITSSAGRSRITVAVIACFFLAALLFVSAICCGSLALILTSNYESTAPHHALASTVALIRQMIWYSSGGMIFFLAGVALIGWLHSKLLGIISTAATAATLVIVSQAFYLFSTAISSNR